MRLPLPRPARRGSVWSGGGSPLPFLLLGACAAAPERDERVAADREDVKLALHRQLDEVLARREAIDREEGEAAEREREELDDLAQRIAERIVRLDPDADANALVQRLERTR